MPSRRASDVASEIWLNHTENRYWPGWTRVGDLPIMSTLAELPESDLCDWRIGPLGPRGSRRGVSGFAGDANGFWQTVCQFGLARGRRCESPGRA